MARSVVRFAAMPPRKYPGFNRRSESRPANPACTVCRAPTEKVRRTARTAFVVYFKCTQCGHVTTVEVPEK